MVRVLVLKPLYNLSDGQMGGKLIGPSAKRERALR
jgi:hypothetical protein